ncbi:hypothetical protein NDU88_001930 [Pleurodeles waltl]|uniref:Uncharacterized protein n=1 Tax=Pleurodeles waltl TaxID=8319 RepID=A0AAV7U8D3_PLEWA|nr:hypothetical protein NDU88_001930 [Pleurodeles waltl]
MQIRSDTTEGAEELAPSYGDGPRCDEKAEDDDPASGILPRDLPPIAGSSAERAAQLETHGTGRCTNSRNHWSVQPEVGSAALRLCVGRLVQERAGRIDLEQQAK